MEGRIALVLPNDLLGFLLFEEGMLGSRVVGPGVRCVEALLDIVSPRKYHLEGFSFWPLSAFGLRWTQVKFAILHHIFAEGLLGPNKEAFCKRYMSNPFIEFPLVYEIKYRWSDQEAPTTSKHFIVARAPGFK